MKRYITVRRDIGTVAEKELNIMPAEPRTGVVRDVMQYLFERLRDKQPVTHKVGDQVYEVCEDGTLGAPVRELLPQWTKPTFTVKTLSALAALVKGTVDDFNGKECALHVSDYDTVDLVSLKADSYGHRHVFARAHHEQETPFPFNEYQTAEMFIIRFRTSFYYNDEAVKVQQLCSNLQAGQSVNVADDGVSQQVTATAGTMTKAGVVIPSGGIPLIPWRTFRDATPVQSNFLLRLRAVKDGLPAVALFDIDQKWKLDTMNSVRIWLESQLKDFRVIA